MMRKMYLYNICRYKIGSPEYGNFKEGTKGLKRTEYK